MEKGSCSWKCCLPACLPGGGLFFAGLAVVLRLAVEPPPDLLYFVGGALRAEERVERALKNGSVFLPEPAGNEDFAAEPGIISGNDPAEMRNRIVRIRQRIVPDLPPRHESAAFHTG